MESQKKPLRIPELVLPGGDLNRVKTAIMFGADAVYVGLDKYSLRKAEVRFTIPEIKKAIDYVHKKGKKIYITFNIFAHNKNLKTIEKDMTMIASFNPDAFIMADLGVIRIAKRVAPKIPIHVSTQANTVNTEDVKFWRDLGVKRVVLARELTLKEITEIHQKVPEMELEVFVHGAMCISYSGRCLLSNYMTGRSANLGQCAQPCRWNYNVYLEEKLRPGEFFKAEESETGTTIMSSKDLRLVRYLPEILKAGVTGLKVEGRNKTAYYLATTALAYNEAINLTLIGKYREKDKVRLEKELEKLSFRDYTEGFIFGQAKRGETYLGRSNQKTWNFVGEMIKKIPVTRALGSEYEVVVKNKIQVGDELEVVTPKGITNDKVLQILNEKNVEISEISPGKENQKAILSLKGIYDSPAFIRKKI